MLCAHVCRDIGAGLGAAQPVCAGAVAYASGATQSHEEASRAISTLTPGGFGAAVAFPAKEVLVEDDEASAEPEGSRESGRTR